MKYTVLCEFFQRDNIQPMELTVDAPCMKSAKLMARIECLKRGIELPKTIEFIKLSIKK